MRTRPLRLPTDDRGITAAEMLVSSALVLVFLPLAGIVVSSAVTTQREVRATTDAGMAAQLVAASVEDGVRFAGTVRLDPWSATHANERLVVSTRAGTASVYTAVCQAWFYDAANETLSTKRVPAGPAAPGALAEPVTREERETWTVLAEGVTRRPVDPSQVDGQMRPLFTHSTTPTAGTVTLDLRLPTSPRAVGEVVTSRDAVVVSTSVTTRSPRDITRSPCS
ncbi:hypothetical protein [Cellulomonas aerilata]|uniref:Prepilin-type N-terminal cleavage/methylation domain-containing protein n=1 Tax=Cellulomonas aerilata TaxID=515326 RepID=A0A512DA88_9CELL|nr:hypothetical protein [Cellulomonas aerilata]GEO33402.1 hypothetical protein CAE01nite_11270 [Cellulomonas aerilata]